MSISSVAVTAGDAAPVAQRVASAVGIAPSNIHAGVKPDGKAALVKKLQAQGCRYTTTANTLCKSSHALCVKCSTRQRSLPAEAACMT